ncbi:hypothetical protein GCM10011504_54240 [Siccirubricoccus deserti]|nr:hypothetical protein GCM10011504_54240 [Siccirubricoccus deserti]
MLRGGGEDLPLGVGEGHGRAPGAGPDQPGPTTRSPADELGEGGAPASAAARVRPFALWLGEVKRKCARWADNAFPQISKVNRDGSTDLEALWLRCLQGVAPVSHLVT